MNLELGEVQIAWMDPFRLLLGMVGGCEKVDRIRVQDRRGTDGSIPQPLFQP